MIASEIKRLLSSLKECDVRYLLADGFTHGPNHTLKLDRNVDIWLEPSSDNARRLIRALRIFGTPMHGIQPEKLATPETQFSLHCRPYQLEFYTYIPGLKFSQSFESRSVFREGTLFVNLISQADLTLAKSSLIRPPDDADPDMSH